MHAPKYAGPRPSRARIITGTALAVAAGLICVQVFGTDSKPASAAAIAPAAGAATTAPTSAAAQQPRFVEQIAIHPSVINTVAAAVKAPKKAKPAAAAAGLTGPAGQVGALGIPVMVLHAYRLAAAKIAVTEPSCKLPWWLLAGIGHTESGHAEAGRLTADGTTRGLILGPRLNGGIAGDAIISDTDQGKLDGDKVYDRAVGPMQFIPSTWARWGVDGNGDGVANPSNIYDATLAAGHYLCAGGRDLSTPAGQDAAVLSYNHSAPYLATVLAWGKAYAHGASSVPDSTLPTVKDVTKARPKLADRPKPKKAVVHKATPARTRASAHPTPTHSSTAPRPTKSATPSGSATPTTTSCAPTTSATSTSPDPSASSSAGAHQKTLAASPLEKTLAASPLEKTLRATASAVATETARTGGDTAASSAGTTTSTSATPTATSTPTGCATSVH